MPVLRGFTLKTPKRRSSMRSPRPSAFFIASKTVSTACSAFDAGMLVFVHHGVDDIELDHTKPPLLAKPMLDSGLQVVKLRARVINCHLAAPSRNAVRDSAVRTHAESTAVFRRKDDGEV